MANQVLYGFIGLKDVLGNRLSTVDAELIAGAIQQSVDEHNRQMDALMSLFVSPVTSATERYKQTGPARLQPLDENGRALPIKPFGYYDVGYPIQMAGSAWGANYVARAKMTVQDANDATAQMLEADMRWMRDHILAALFASATWTHTDPQYGSLTIQPLANGDTVTYAVQTGADSGTTDTHQLAQANAIGAGTDNPFPGIRNELLEHPENSGDVGVFLPTGLKATTQALATFNPIADPNIQPGSGTDRLVGTLGVATPGTLIGYEDSGVWLVEWPSMPANYLIATTTGGDRPLGMREDPEAELRGFKRVAERDNHPFYESQWLRRAGFGARNRVGAVVQRISNGTYAVPTNYTSPMP
jgi:hypothetical protein